MGVGSIRGGGGRGGTKGAGKASGKSTVGKGGEAPKASESGSLGTVVGCNDLVGSSEVSNAGEAVSAEQLASRIAKALRAGEISSKSEAARLLVADILKERMNIQLKGLQERIAEEISEDPGLAQKLERIWQKA